ncbi:MAG: radical SAM protein, partial [Clostridia bacterium]|nr:radical SAM protein [Clostridia bacterium]
GGEPLLRKDDILRLARKHQNLTFGVFTNATLIDAATADAIAATPNLNMFISIEGGKEETDFRRGAGVYDKCLNAMKLLRERGVAFAFSACYHAKNCETVASDAYLDWLREQGAWMGWLFKYAPIGKDADLSLVCTPRQRAWVRQQIADYCARERYTIIDFWNMGHVATGCVAAGNGFIHINARGDVEPCAFCHYADSNIRDESLIEALQSPFFRAFRSAQPFTDNPLIACPMLDHPQSLVDVCAAGGAYSTHYDAPETPEALAEKCHDAAKAWQPVAEQLYAQLDPRWQRIFAGVSRAHRLRVKCFDRPLATKPKEER